MRPGGDGKWLLVIGGRSAAIDQSVNQSISQ
jgi:hypothetical protein